MAVNPSPSNDPYFDDPSNLEELEKRIEDYKTGKSEIMITLYIAEEIADFLYSI